MYRDNDKSHSEIEGAIPILEYLSQKVWEDRWEHSSPNTPPALTTLSRTLGIRAKACQSEAQIEAKALAIEKCLEDLEDKLKNHSWTFILSSDISPVDCAAGPIIPTYLRHDAEAQLKFPDYQGTISCYWKRGQPGSGF
jgi:glutathione S-transferase